MVIDAGKAIQLFEDSRGFLLGTPQGGTPCQDPEKARDTFNNLAFRDILRSLNHLPLTLDS